MKNNKSPLQPAPSSLAVSSNETRSGHNDGNKANTRKAPTQTKSKQGYINKPVSRKHLSTFYGTNSNRSLSRSLSAQASKLKNDKPKPNIPTLDILRRSKFIFLRVSTQDKDFLKGSMNSLEILGSTGEHLFYSKEMEGTGKRNSIGASCDRIFCILSLDGNELIRMEGGIFSGGKIRKGQRKHDKYLACYRGSICIGEVAEKSHRCPAPRQLVITDDKQTEVALLHGDNLSHDNVCCCISKKKIECNHYTILVPGSISRMGEIGKIAKFYPDVPRCLDDCFGLELPEALGHTERILLLASLFVLYQPPASSEVPTKLLKLTS